MKFLIQYSYIEIEIEMNFILNFPCICVTKCVRAQCRSPFSISTNSLLTNGYAKIYWNIQNVVEHHHNEQ